MSFRTDLASEALEGRQESLPGVTSQSEAFESLAIHTVTIRDPYSAEKLGKPEGVYLTLETKALSSGAPSSPEELGEAARRLGALLPKEGLILVAGLGNQQITPDALGPKTASLVLATRHITGELARSAGLEHLRPVAVLAPGVLGQTGVETGEIIEALVRRLAPAAVIAVDALAAHSLSRLGNTVQFSDTGISPGSGVANARKELCEKSLGVPVVSMGIPTVVDASTLAADLLPGSRENLPPEGKTMMVTPRDIDLVIDRGSRFLSSVINLALQPSLSLEDILFLTA